MTKVLCILVCLLSLSIATFKNPIFVSQDPWVTKVNGTYYYTESYCNVAHICVKASTTLTGLSSAPWIGLWSSQSGNINSGDIWAPEIHYVFGGWYIYYAADDGNNANHRLFVLKGDSPTGPFVEAQTGYPHGKLQDSTDYWAIDPNVFTAANGQVYITWSCTNNAVGSFPQQVCLAPLKNAVTIGGPTVFLSTPTASWETRTAAIQEGPVGYTYAGQTYITYSASASWVPNDYAVGLLSLTPGANPAQASSWTKSGPILDHHGTVYGPGSVVFTPSVDGSEYWVVYHGIENSNCQPNAYSCRDIRMQKMFFDSVGYPILGYPANPGVVLQSPAGEGGAPRGTTLIANFGNAWGDAAEGNTNSGVVAGKWSYTDRFSATSALGGTWDQIFSPWNPNPVSFTAHVEVQHVQTGTTVSFPKYGFYCSYDDANNHAELFLDINYKALASHAVVGGVDQGWQNANLPSNFDPSQWHSLDCKKSGSTYTFTLDANSGNTVSYSRNFQLTNGQTGLVVVDTIANYRNLQLYPA